MNRTCQTIKEMLYQRNYDIEEETEDNIIGVNKKGEHICVFTHICSKFNIDRVKEYISHMHKMEYNHCIIIYSGSSTPMATKLAESSIEIDMELFTEEELQYNITKHYLVPKHIKLSDEDAESFKIKYGTKFPVILRSDPIARFYHYKRGDVIKIERNGAFISHRIVR